MEDLPDELFQSETLDSMSAPGSSAMLYVPEGLTPLMQVYTRFALAREFDLQRGILVLSLRVKSKPFSTNTRFLRPF